MLHKSKVFDAWKRSMFPNLSGLSVSVSVKRDVDRKEKPRETVQWHSNAKLSEANTLQELRTIMNKLKTKYGNCKHHMATEPISNLQVFNESTRLMQFYLLEELAGKTDTEDWVMDPFHAYMESDTTSANINDALTSTESQDDVPRATGLYKMFTMPNTPTAPKDLYVTRGHASEKGFLDQACGEHLEVGSVFTVPRFVSTSNADPMEYINDGHLLSLKFGPLEMCCMMQIRIKKGTPILLGVMDPGQPHWEEEELLLPPGLLYVYTGTVHQTIPRSYTSDDGDEIIENVLLEVRTYDAMVPPD